MVPLAVVQEREWMSPCLYFILCRTQGPSRPIPYHAFNAPCLSTEANLPFPQHIVLRLTSNGTGWYYGRILSQCYVMLSSWRQNLHFMYLKFLKILNGLMFRKYVYSAPTFGFCIRNFDKWSSHLIALLSLYFSTQSPQKNEAFSCPEKSFSIGCWRQSVPVLSAIVSQLFLRPLRLRLSSAVPPIPTRLHCVQNDSLNFCSLNGNVNTQKTVTGPQIIAG
jgi:hypothetical protein